jgi:hypothetical protein
MKTSPLLVEVRPGHVTFEMGKSSPIACLGHYEDFLPRRGEIILQGTDALVFIVKIKFQNAWGGSGPCPKVKKVYKVVESKAFLQPYDVYR